MTQLIHETPEWDSSGFVLLAEAVPDIILEIRYYSTYNFIGERVCGYEEPVALITKEAADALRNISDIAIRNGCRLKVYDAYRPQCAVDHFIRWGDDSDDQRMKHIFYPDMEKQWLFERDFISRESSHTRGSTVDVTLVDINSGKELDMGGVFDYFGDISYQAYTSGLTETQLANRALLRSLMLDHGFRAIRSEWWHYTLCNEPYPDTYFRFPVNSRSLAR